jgi:DNA-binding LacI/PurR family transcriptional regulator
MCCRDVELGVWGHSNDCLTAGVKDRLIYGVPRFTGKRSISIKDIARLASVSHSTVSRALHNSPLVNSETTERIRRIAFESGYLASAVARSLVNRATKTVGVVVTTIADPFIGEVVSGIESVANEQGYSVLLANSDADPEREMRTVRSFGERRVDGILVTASRVGNVYGSMLRNMNVPLIFINNQFPGNSSYSVMIDNVPASQAAVAHLIGLGHRRIAYIGDSSGFQSDTERFTGYQLALQAAGISQQPELTCHGDGKPELGGRMMEQLLRLSDRPTAVFCYNDMTALGALRAARAQGLQVPCDLSLVGFDDLFLSSYTTPALTTVRQPKHDMGRKAMAILLELLGGSEPASEFVVKGELIIRDSTARHGA